MQEIPKGRIMSTTEARNWLQNAGFTPEEKNAFQRAAIAVFGHKLQAALLNAEASTEAIYFTLTFKEIRKELGDPTLHAKRLRQAMFAMEDDFHKLGWKMGKDRYNGSFKFSGKLTAEAKLSLVK